MLIQMIFRRATQNAVWPISLQPVPSTLNHVPGSIICPIEPTGCSSRFSPFAGGCSELAALAELIYRRNP